MVIDFVFGGSDLVTRMTDIAANIGEHEYFFAFEFSSGDYFFRRTTASPDLVLECNSDASSKREIGLSEYTGWLGDKYGFPGGSSFRRCVGPFSRVWRKDNLIFNKPLSAAARAPDGQAIDTLLQMFDGYESLAALFQLKKEAEAESKALNAAQKRHIVPSIGKREYRENVRRIAELNQEVSTLRRRLGQLTIGAREIASEQLLETSAERDKLIKQRTSGRRRLERLEQSLEEAKSPISKRLEALTVLFPGIDAERIRRIDAFHHNVATILKAEIRASKEKTLQQLRTLADEIVRFDNTIDELLASEGVRAPGSPVVDRFIFLSAEISRREEENRILDLKQDFQSAKAKTKASAQEARSEAIADKQSTINLQLANLAQRVLGGKSRAPELLIGTSSYSLEFQSDKGTGTAHAGLVLFDLAILLLSSVPFAIHDSLLLKNIEVGVVDTLVNEYARSEKQIFVAIDELGRFSPRTKSTLEESAVISLSPESVLFDRTWKEGGRDT